MPPGAGLARHRGGTSSNHGAPSTWRTIAAIWIWCIAKTIAVAPHRRPSSKQAAAMVSNETPPPPYSVGMQRRQRTL